MIEGHQKMEENGQDLFFYFFGGKLSVEENAIQFLEEKVYGRLT